MKFSILLFIIGFTLPAFSRNTKYTDTGELFFIRVHFLYGSKPKYIYRKEEPRWFGGKLGGHVGVELDTQRILHFLPIGTVKILPNNREPDAQFTEGSWNDFREALGGIADSNKTTSFVIPITAKQKMLLDSIAVIYLKNVPYDYAFFGMRCGSAAYDILAQLAILKPMSYRQTWRAIFYPAKLRKRLFKLAHSNQWAVIHNKGSKKRKWERDGRSFPQLLE